MDLLSDGFVLLGRTGSKSGWSFWLVRTNLDGKVLWDAKYGGQGSHQSCGLGTLADGFVLAGQTSVPGGSAATWRLIRTDTQGKVLWDKQFSGKDYNGAYGFAKAADGFLIVGQVSGKPESYDGRIVRTDLDGNILWDKAYGGAGFDMFARLLVLPEGGYLAAGQTTSQGSGAGDFWLVRLDGSGNVQWERTYGTAADEGAWALAAVPTGFAFGGYTIAVAGNDILVSEHILRTDVLGNLLWDRGFSIGKGGSLSGLIALPDGLLVSGSTQIFGAVNADAWLLRTDAFGNSNCADSGSCASAVISDCSDQNACTTDWCDSVSGGCHHAAIPGGTPCGVGVKCLGGTCQ